MGTGRQSSKKKPMKSKAHKTKSAPGLRVQSSNHHSAAAPESAPEQKPKLPAVPAIDFARRRANRELSTEQLLAVLQQHAPQFYALAEVVGHWVWVQFTGKQPSEVTAALAEFGFHWNNKRQVWQHPCGALTSGAKNDPREKYPTHFAADTKAA
jgi:hypothetical protein